MCNFHFKHFDGLLFQIAGGAEKRGKGGEQPQASNMYEMQWNEELARIAQVNSLQNVLKVNNANSNFVSTGLVSYHKSFHSERHRQ